MKRINPVAWSTRLVAATALFLLPGLLPAQTLTLRNDTRTAVLVQGATLVRGQVQRERPTLLHPGETLRTTLKGNKLISVYDARVPSRILYQGTINDCGEDMTYTMRPATLPGRVKLDTTRPDVATVLPTLSR